MSYAEIQKSEEGPGNSLEGGNTEVFNGGENERLGGMEARGDGEEERLLPFAEGEELCIIEPFQNQTEKCKRFHVLGADQDLIGGHIRDKKKS